MFSIEQSAGDLNLTISFIRDSNGVYRDFSSKFSELSGLPGHLKGGRFSLSDTKWGESETCRASDIKAKRIPGKYSPSIEALTIDGKIREFLILKKMLKNNAIRAQMIETDDFGGVSCNDLALGFIKSGKLYVPEIEQYVDRVDIATLYCIMLGKGSYQEAADMCGVHVGTIKYRVKRFLNLFGVYYVPNVRKQILSSNFSTLLFYIYDSGYLTATFYEQHGFDL